MKTLFRIAFLALVIILVVKCCQGQNLKTVLHDRSTAVEDYAGIFSDEEKSALNTQLAGFFDTVQVAVMTIKSLDGAEIAETSTRLFNRWGIGSKSNNGLLLLIAVDDHKMFAATGSGIQGDITDYQAAALQKEIAVPEFKAKRYYQGTSKLLAAYVALLQPAAVEYKAHADAAMAASDDTDYLWWLLLLPLSILLGGLAYISYLNNKKRQAHLKTMMEKNVRKPYPSDLFPVGPIRTVETTIPPLFPYGYPQPIIDPKKNKPKPKSSPSSSYSSSSSNDDSYTPPSSYSSYDSGSSSSSSSDSGSSSSGFDFSGGSSDGGGGGSDW